jgi:hypothetical protein
MVTAGKIDVIQAQWRQMGQIAKCRIVPLSFKIIDGSRQVRRPPRALDVKSLVSAPRCSRAQRSDVLHAPLVTRVPVSDPAQGRVARLRNRDTLPLLATSPAQCQSVVFDPLPQGQRRSSIHTIYGQVQRSCRPAQIDS